MARAFVFGDDVNTDALAPGPYMQLPPAEMAKHCLEPLDPGFAATVRPGDILVGGRNFGMGSAREQAAVVLQVLGVAAVLARSFARIFYRNIINLGVPALVIPETVEIADGDRITLDPVAGRLVNETRGKAADLMALPPHLVAMIADGGLIPHLEKTLKQGSLRHGI